MPDSGLFVSAGDEVGEYTITIACECYGHRELVGRILAKLPDFNGELVWGAPCTPDPGSVMGDADLVLVVSDKRSLAMGIARISTYRLLEQAALLVYLQDGDAVLKEEIPGLMLPASSLAAGFFTLVGALFTPVIPPGSVCIEWVDTRHILLMAGQMVIEEARGPELEAVIEDALARLRESASGRKILGLQASILCRRDKLAARHVCRLASACREVIDGDTAFFIGAPFLERFESEHYEVRLAAKIACAPGLDTPS